MLAFQACAQDVNCAKETIRRYMSNFAQVKLNITIFFKIMLSIE